MRRNQCCYIAFICLIFSQIEGLASSADLDSLISKDRFHDGTRLLAENSETTMQSQVKPRADDITERPSKLGKTSSTPEFVDKFSSDRKKVADFSASVLSGYLSKLPKDRAGDYGFRLPEHISKATLLSPIPIFFPDRVRSMERSVIEKSLETQPDLWAVPIVVDGYIPCLLQVSFKNKEQPEVESLGSSYKAKRIDAGLRLLGWP